MRNKKKLCRAVITVEASYIVPWAVILTALLITMTFFVHNRVWYTAAACEAAVSGNRYAEGSGTRYAETTLQQRIRDQAMPGGEPERQVICTQDATEVRISGQDFPAFSEFFSWSVEKKVKKVRPVKVVRGKWILTGVLDRLGQNGMQE